MNRKPARIVTGKPTAKIFSCGAARVITPKATLIIRIAVRVGRPSSRALANS
jgi:hypothetical protein